MRLAATRNALISLVLISLVLISLVLIALACGGASAQCTPQWAQGMFTSQGLDAEVRAFCMYNGELYVGGSFTKVGNVGAKHIARWNGFSWEPVGAGIAGTVNVDVNVLCVYNGELYAGGVFETAGGVAAVNIARWNGTFWQDVGGGPSGDGLYRFLDVYALCVYNGQLYMGGSTLSDGARIWAWNGVSWQGVGTGPGVSHTVVYALCVYNGELYAGGSFSTKGGSTYCHIARWNGESWQDVGCDGVVYALAVCGGELYAGGMFTSAGGTAARSIARWNGDSWRPVGTGLGGERPSVFALCVYNGELYAGGYLFTTAGGVAANRIARWNGVTWQAVGTGMVDRNDRVLAMSAFMDELYVGGRFASVGGSDANYVARWNGTSWRDVGANKGLDGPVKDMCVYCGELYVGGRFTKAGEVTSECIAKWNGVSWLPVGTGMEQGRVEALCVYKGELYAGGRFFTAGGVAANHMARWNGSSWQPVGAGVDKGYYTSVSDVCVYNGELYVGGYFASAGGVAANGIARWNGVSWQSVGTGIDQGEDSAVYDLCVYNGELYVGGYFTSAGGVTANGIARWNGVSWQSVGPGMVNHNGWSRFLRVFALCVHDGELYAGGWFTGAGVVAAPAIARWNGATWQPAGEGINDNVYDLCEYDDGLGPAPALYAGGGLTLAGGHVSVCIARWGCLYTAQTCDVPSVKSKTDGALVGITGEVSTAVFGDAFYVSHVDGGLQTGGIRVEMAGHGVTPGKLTTVTGRTGTTVDGERYINASSVTCGESATAKPEFMPLKSLGGGTLGYQGGVWGWRLVKNDSGRLVREWGPAVGLNNIGSLVRVSGKVTYVDASNFTIDDGSDIAVHCIAPTGTTVSPLWRYVAVTGICSCERVGGELHARLLVRSGADIQPLLSDSLSTWPSHAVSQYELLRD